jgi:hypothetical protein
MRPGLFFDTCWSLLSLIERAEFVKESRRGAPARAFPCLWLHPSGPDQIRKFHAEQDPSRDSRAGIEPAVPAFDAGSVAIRYKELLLKVEMRGIEPLASCLQSRRSPN